MREKESQSQKGEKLNDKEDRVEEQTFEEYTIKSTETLSTATSVLGWHSPSRRLSMAGEVVSYATSEEELEEDDDFGFIDDSHRSHRSDFPIHDEYGESNAFELYHDEYGSPNSSSHRYRSAMPLSPSPRRRPQQRQEQ